MTGEVLGIDVGGSSVKAGLVDVQRGTVSGALISAPTPRPCTPASLIPVLAALAGRLAGASGRAGVAFPSVIKGGTAYTAANIDAGWIGTNGAALAAEALGRPVLMLNDADAAGIAEMRFGVTPDINALATIMILIVATGIAISTVWMRYRERRRERDLQLAAAANL